MTIIKRYSNRKLYDTNQSSYVTLDEIAEMVRAGEDVQIIDNKTGEDLTRVTLAQIVFENEKKERKGLPLHALKMIVQSPSELFSRLRDEVTDFREQTQQQVGRIKEQARQQHEELVSPLRDVIETIQHNIDDFQEKIDERLRATSTQLRAPLNLMLDEVHELRKRLEALEAHLLEAMEKSRRPKADSRAEGDEADTLDEADEHDTTAEKDAESEALAD